MSWVTVLKYEGGSNCFVIRYEDLMKIGNFSIHRVAELSGLTTLLNLVI